MNQTPHCHSSNHSLPASRTIFLIGYRGSEVSVAQHLAERLHYTWLDADAVLEQRHGRNIRQIFAQDGEPAFRDMESAILTELCQLERHVIATGGGVILRPGNREKLKKAGIVVWLKADPTTLWQRMQTDATTAERRPNLTVGGIAEIEDLLQIREPYYTECAHFMVDTVGRSVEDVAEAIAQYLSRRE